MHDIINSFNKRCIPDDSTAGNKYIRWHFIILTLSLPGKFYLDILETPGKFLVICSASFKKSPKIDFFSQLFEKKSHELTPTVYGKKIHCTYSLDVTHKKTVIQKEK
jgi:hypothetical protein